MSNFFFDKEETNLFVTHGPLKERNSSRIIEGVYKIDLEKLLKGTPSSEHLTVFNGVGQATTADAYFTVDPTGFDQADEIEFIKHIRAISSSANSNSNKNIGINSRDIYGAISGEKYVYLFRDNEFKMYIADDMSRELRLISNNGNSFYSQKENLSFKFDGENFLSVISGSVVKFRSGKMEFVSKPGGSRSSLIHGRTPLEYTGYFSSDGLHFLRPNGATQDRIREDRKYFKNEYVTSITLNEQADAYVVSSYGSLGYDGRYRHRIYVKNRHADIFCGDKGMGYRFSITNSGGSEGVWVERYEVSESAPSVVYIHGGPVEYQEEMETTQIKFFLEMGLNVDVINYGGSNYNYTLSNKLKTRNELSISNDSKNIEKYVFTKYKNRSDSILYAESFGGLFYRHFRQSFFKKFNKVILYAPLGSGNFDNFSSVKMAFAKSTLGNRIFKNDYDRPFFENLTNCQLKSETLIIVGENDTNVSPLYDYRNCVGDKRLRLRMHAGDHDQNANENFDFIAKYIKE